MNYDKTSKKLLDKQSFPYYEIFNFSFQKQNKQREREDTWKWKEAPIF